MIQAFHEIKQWIQIDKLTLMVHYHLLLLLNHFECFFFNYFLVFLYKNGKGKRLEKMQYDDKCQTLNSCRTFVSNLLIKDLWLIRYD